MGGKREGARLTSSEAFEYKLGQWVSKKLKTENPGPGEEDWQGKGNKEEQDRMEGISNKKNGEWIRNIALGESSAESAHQTRGDGKTNKTGLPHRR